MSELTPGLRAETEITVTEADTASRWGSGLVSVYSTPALVGQMENTAVMALTAHLPPGQTTVGGRIDARAEAQDGCVRVTVADQGPGIPAEDRQRIFERFYRADTARTRSRPGTGLGLAIVRAIAHAHDGQVIVQSQVGMGSTFSLSIPVSHPSQSR